MAITIWHARLRMSARGEPSCRNVKVCIVERLFSIGTPDHFVASPNSSQQRRSIHSSRQKTSNIAEHRGQPLIQPSQAPLSVLPWGIVLRSLATTIFSSSPVLLPPSLRIMDALAHSKSPLFNPDKNPVLRYALKNSFYAQFCAGENAAEVRNTVAKLKNIGFTGVILGYAKEVVLEKKEDADTAIGEESEEAQDAIENEVKPWAAGSLETVRLADEGDYVAIKLTGAGRLAIQQLSRRLPATPILSRSIHSICELAHQRGVRLLFDAEQNKLQGGIDEWAIHFAQKYNTLPNRVTIYGTYQAYKKCTPEVLSRHLATAQQNHFALGVKLVRGAYLNTDPREIFHDTKEQTDRCYDDISASLITRQWSDRVKGQGRYPDTQVILATHNPESVHHARAICDAGDAKSYVSFAQLQGMANEISCELVGESQSRRVMSPNWSPVPVVKYVVWGTTGECMKYLLRRAQENKDAVQQTQSDRNTLFGELVRRCKGAFGLALR